MHDMTLRSRDLLALSLAAISFTSLACNDSGDPELTGAAELGSESSGMDEDTTPPKDAKTMLQEWAQARGLALPRYRETERKGPPHAPIFSVEVTVSGIAPVIGIGPSKRSAEQAAADLALVRVQERDK